MTKTTITEYPDGKRYIKSQSWFIGEKMQGAKKKQAEIKFGGVQDEQTF